MNDKLSSKVLSVTWQYYLSRPFSLFQTSVWNKWYDSQEIKDILGIRLIKGFFVEYPKGMVRHYRKDLSMNAMYKSIKNIAETDSILNEKLLDRGVEENEKVKKLISEKAVLELNEAFTLCIQVALVGTIFPYFAGDILLKKYGEQSPITKKAVALRATSYYPQIFSELLIPAAKRELLNQNKISPDFLPYILIDEIRSRDVDDTIQERKKLSDAGEYFIYFSDGNSKIVTYTQDPSDYLRKVDHAFFDSKIEIKGMIGHVGKVRGKVRQVLTNDLSNIIFNDGEILVAVSTNPVLVPIMQRAAAIVTDEGGLLSHASIMSREFGKPCVIATKIATKVLRDGMMVEVDANKGVVKILK